MIKKIDKEFCLTDDSVNVYSYRLKTSGLLLDRFRPAIGFLMHDRSKGVAVRWEDFRFDGDKLYAKPVINTSLFPDLADQIQEGFYDAASVGHIVALEFDENDRLEGQQGPTVTKWFPRECSIVDIPGNYNALARLYDVNDNVLQDLSDSGKENFYIPMNKEQQIIVNPFLLALMNLQANTTQDQFNTHIADLVAKAAQSDKYKQELENLKAEHASADVKDILAKAQDERKVTNKMAEQLAVDYKGNPEGLKKLVATLHSQVLVTEQPADNYPNNFPDKFKGKSYSDLYAENLLEELSSSYPDYYKQLKEKSNQKK